MDYNKPIKKGTEYPELTGEVFGMNSLGQVGELQPNYTSRTETISVADMMEKYSHVFTNDQLTALKETLIPENPVKDNGGKPKLNFFKARQKGGSQLTQKMVLDYLLSQSPVNDNDTAEEPQGQSELPLLSVYLRDLPRMILETIFVDPDKLYPADAFGIHGKVKAKVMGCDLAPHHITYIINDEIARIEEEETRSPERSRELTRDLFPQKFDLNLGELNVDDFKWDPTAGQKRYGHTVSPGVVFPYGTDGIYTGGVDPALPGIQPEDPTRFMDPSMPGINGTTFEVKLTGSITGIDSIT